MAHVDFPVMRQQTRFKYSPTDTCPRCGDEEDTITHTLKCQLRHTDKWKVELQDGLKKSQIGPQTRALIIHVIKCFATDTDYNISSDYDGLTQAVCLDQPMLGWKNFLQEKLLPDWMNIINNKQEQNGLPHNLRAVPQMMTDLVTTTLNLWRTQCDFLH